MPGRWGGRESEKSGARDAPREPGMTERWRNMVRGEGRRIGEKMAKAYFAPDREERRRLAGLPGAKFDQNGNLSNVEEMRAVLKARQNR